MPALSNRLLHILKITTTLCLDAVKRGMSSTAKQSSLALCDAQEQGNSDSTLDDVACLLGCTRSSLHGETSFVYLV